MPRFSVQPGDVPREAAARRMGMAAEAFEQTLPKLIARGFPKPDPDTGNFDLDAIDAWRRSRHPSLFSSTPPAARDASTNFAERIASIKGGRG